MRQLRRSLAALPHVRKVTDITNVRQIKGDAAGIDVGEFISPDIKADELGAKRGEALKHPYYSGLYISTGGRSLGIVVETEIIRGEVQYKIDLTRQIRALLAQEPYRGWHPAAAGAPIIDADVRDIVSRESGMFGGLVFALVAIGFLYVFRSVAGVALPLTVAALSIVCCFGLMGMMGAPVTILTPIIPSFMISVGVGTCVFLVTQIYANVHEGMSVRDAAASSIRTAGVPGAMAALTTAGAMLAFSSSDIAPVQDIGVTLGIGLLISLVLTLILVPVGFTFYRKVPRSPRREQLMHGRVHRIDRICDLVLAAPYRILAGAAVVLVAAVIGIAQLDTDYYYLGNFKESTRIRQDYDAVDSKIHASSAIEILVKGRGADAFKEPALLGALDRLQAAADGFQQFPTKTYSLVNVVKEINQAIRDGDPAAYRLPNTREEIAQGLLLFESSGSDETKNLVSPDYSLARLTVRVPTLSDKQYEPLIALLQSEAARQFAGTGAEVTITGLVPMWIKISSYLSTTQAEALLLAVGVVCFVMIIMARSVAVGIAMTCTNLFAVILVLGLMGWLGIMLDPYTILIADIAIGILDDDTMHFVKHVQYQMDRGRSFKDAVRSTYRSAGQAMFYMAAVLICSFAIYSLSSVASLTKFGLLVGLTLLFGIATEFLLTTPVLMVLHRFGLLKGKATPAGRGEAAHVGAAE
jgi:predicted RND superfamily exporter protein